MGGIKNKDKIHLVESDGKYACVKACNITECKATKFKSKVNCKNCLHIIKLKSKTQVKQVENKELPEERTFWAEDCECDEAIGGIFFKGAYDLIRFIQKVNMTKGKVVGLSIDNSNKIELFIDAK